MEAKRVFEVVKTIPEGKVMTYGDVARLAGAPRCARAVGGILHRNRTPIVVPCHRVVFADGSLAPSFAFGGERVQREWLEREGVVFRPDGRVDMASCRVVIL